jgi:Mg-chelatase subunit ChlD
MPLPATHLFVRASLHGSPSPGPANPSCGNGITEPGEQCDPNDLGTPLPLCTEFGLMPIGTTDRVRCRPNCTFEKGEGASGPCQAYFPSPMGEQCALTAGLVEACVDGASAPEPPPGVTCASFGFASGSLSCSLCSLDLGSCGPIAGTCGDGVIDPGEQCDMGADNGDTFVPALDSGGQPVTCEPFYGLTGAGAFVSCSNNCTFEKLRCNQHCAGTAGQNEACTAFGGEQIPPASCGDFGFAVGEARCSSCSLNLGGCGPGFDPSSLDSALATSPVDSPWLRAVDVLGDVHSVRLFALALTSELWQVHALGLGEEYVGGTPGVPLHLRTFQLRFDPESQQVVAVQSGFGPEVAGTAGTLMLGGVPADGSGEGSPPFVVGPVGQAPALSVLVDFSGVRQQPWLQYSDMPGGPSGSAKFLAGTTFARGPDPALPPIGRCDDPTLCQQLWNSSIESWEGTHHRWAALYATHLQPLRDSGALMMALSDREVLELVLPFKYPGTGLMSEAPETPIADPPADCGGELGWDDAAVAGLLPDGIVLVLDRSHSMVTPIDANVTYGTGTRESRMAFARAAARDFLDLTATRPGTRPQLGLVSFESSATLEQSLAELVTGPAGAGQVELGAFKGIVDTLTPTGRTAIGLALRQAGDLFAGTAFGAKAIVLLSDGENNEPNPLGEFAPLDVAQALATESVRVFTIPTGHAADKMLMAEIARITGGAMFHAEVGDELPAVFAEAYARASGEGLVLPRTSITVAGTAACGPAEFPCDIGTSPTTTPLGCACVASGAPPPVQSISFSVDESATRLNVLLSVRNADITTWNPRFQLLDPSGVVRLDQSSPEVLSDGFYRILSVLTPDVGTWTLRLGAIGLPVQHQFVQAHVEGAGPDCYADLVRSVLEPGESAVLSAAASYGGRAIAAPNITMSLTRPDKSVVSFAFGEPTEGGDRSLVIPAAYLDMRGIYQVDVSCGVPDAAPFALGEGAAGPEAGGSANHSPGFERATSVAFFADVSGQVPLPPGEDCDYDGTPNELEADVDTDGDGLPDACDEDDDADDIPDVFDPDPKNPLCHVPACPIADAGPDQIVECIADGAAVVTLDGSGSSDPDGQPLSYAWSSSVTLESADQAVATGTFPLGTTSATLTVSDGPNSVSDSMLATVLDLTPPELWPPADVVAPTCGSVTLGQPTATDACGGPVTIVNDAPTSFKAGKHVVTWYAIDQFANVAHATQIVIVGLGNDPSCCPAGTNVLIGTSNNDTLIGTAGSDCILGLGGQDVLKGMGGSDFLSGGDGDDVIEGGDGHDYLEGGTGQDTLRGQNGDDVVLGGDGDDQCYGGPGNDRLYGGQGQDKLYGYIGDDWLFGDDGDDRLEGEAGNDVLNGGGLHDVCIGGPGTDTFLLCEVQQ